MPKVSKKNVSPVLHDVKWPKPLESSERPRKIISELRTGNIGKGFAVFIFAAVVFMALSWYVLGKDSSEKESVTSSAPFSANIRDAWLKGLRSIKVFRGFSFHAVGLLGNISSAQSLFGDVLQGRRGDEFIALLKNTKSAIAAFKNDVQSLGLLREELPFPFQGENPVVVGADLAQAEELLGAFIPWLEGEREVVVLFQNPSELRPAGGFLGSLARMKIKSGAVQDLQVFDVNEIDRTLSLKRAAPKPLQALSGRWFTRDTNWFFNFPDSAARVTEFMESSDAFRGRNIEAVIAMSDRVVKDVLEVTGPIHLPNENITLTSENFLKEIQGRVQENRSEKESDPKHVLKEFLPLLLQKIDGLSVAGKEKLGRFAKSWLDEKDMMLYADDKKLEQFFSRYGWSGEVASLPQEFEGDYLAFVSSNMGSGKSDIVIRRSIALKSDIQPDGKVKNTLSILRAHEGDRETAWWYKTTNESYLTVFAVPGAELSIVEGLSMKKIPARDVKGLSTDPLVLSIESGVERKLLLPDVSIFKEAGKRVFGFWSRLEAGKEKAVSLEYSHRLYRTPYDGMKYQFIFDKQSGSEGEYKFEFTAPPGFVWAENDGFIYKYATSDPPGRLTIPLTFKKIE